jgi:hypothetical protein
VNQPSELDQVNVWIKALSEKTVSSRRTEPEAMAAAEMVGLLLERCAMTMDEIDVRKEPCVKVEVPIGGR